MQICLTTRRLTLRPLRMEDAQSVVDLIGDYQVSKMLARVPHPYGREDALQWIEGLRAQESAEPYTFAIDRGHGLIGVIGYHERSEDPEIGYWLGRPHWGQGLMSEACRAAVEWRFAAFSCRKILSGAFTINTPSQRILSKLGFVETGRNMINCKARDKRMAHITMQLTRERFASLIE